MKKELNDFAKDQFRILKENYEHLKTSYDKGSMPYIRRVNYLDGRKTELWALVQKFLDEKDFDFDNFGFKP